MKTKLFILIAIFSLAISLAFLKSSYTTVTANQKTSSETEIIPLAPVQVTNTADSGEGSLRAAIAIANQTAGTMIQFNIPKTDPGFNGTVFVIRVNTALPTITQATTSVDGATQTAIENTNPAGPEIVLDGSLAPSLTDGLRIGASSCTIKSINIRNFFGGNGISVIAASRSTTVNNCFIGTDETGAIAAGNLNGISILAASNGSVIGGTLATGNIISGNIATGIVINGIGSDNNLVAGNIIGLDSNTSRNQLPNLGDGIMVAGGAKANMIGMNTSDTANTIGGNLGNGINFLGSGTNNNTVAGNFIGVLSNNAARGNALSGVMFADNASINTVGPGNVLAFNSRNGVTVGQTITGNGVSRNTITRNSIFSNVGLGIDLGNNGPTANDDNDVDNGPNTLLNFPQITSVVNNGNSITVTGTVDVANPMTARVEIFTNTLPVPGSDPTGFGEGQTFVASPTPNAQGMFTATFTSSPNIVVSSITIDSMGNTSEFSAVFQLGGGQADLIVRNLVVTPTTVNAGGMIQVAFTLVNQGTATAGVSRQNIVFSTDNVITAQDTVLATVTANVLSPQSSQPFTQIITIPMNLSSGQFFIGVIADATGMITEMDETNNTTSVMINVNSMPDLLIGGFRLNPTTVTPGNTVRVDFTVTNQGSDDAPSHVEEVRLSRDNIFGLDDILLRTETLASLRPGEVARFSLDVRIPDDTVPGSYFIGVTVDARSTVVESDETNNQASGAISVSGLIDLDLTNLILSPNTGASGTRVTVSFQLLNRGTIQSPAVNLVIRFSLDQTINNNDPLLSTLTSNPLNAGDTVTLSTTISIPDNVNPGQRFIGVVADPQDVIPESNENNNTIAAIFTIADLASPIVRVTSPNGGELATAG
ncbi:MAG: CARDB domain-containing protein, partial [Blastocatellia bacterium]